ncbi:MAG: hypothetical protein ACN4GM_04345 [Gammaproteobacteria bacterium]
MKTPILGMTLAACLAANSVLAQTDEERIKSLEQQVSDLTEMMEDIAQSSNQSDVHLGGYGELHYSNLDANGVDQIELDFQRFVMFFGYDFNDHMRFVSEFEIEHVIASAGSRGAVEIEQAYLEFDLRSNMLLRTGIMLMPIGIINETHEPTTFYGVERPIIEQTIIPSTWWSGGLALNHYLDNGISYDLLITEGLKTEDPATSTTADPFDIKAGKQKTSFASAHDLAVTGRIKYTGTTGMELAAYAQYQPDLDQSAIDSYAESATLLGGHGIFRFYDFTATALYARWDLAGDDAELAGKDEQVGHYVELSYKPVEKIGVFVRHNQWSQQTGIEKEQSDIGINYWPDQDIVFKFDMQSQNEDAGNVDGFNLGMGYQF